MRTLAVILIFFLYGESATAQQLSSSKISLEQELAAISQEIKEAIAQTDACKKAFVNLSKNIKEQQINNAFQKDVPLVEMWRDDLISKGYVFPQPLDPNHSEAIHSALNEGAVILDLNSSLTPEIAKKMRHAIVSKPVLRFLNTLFRTADFGTSDLRNTSFVKTGKISEEEIRQFYKELHQVTQELEIAISAADGQDIRFAKFAGQVTDNRPATSPSGHYHNTTQSSRDWVTVVYTIFGPAGTLFATKDSQPAITLPGQALLLPERKRNRTILGEIGPFPLHATPHLPGERFVLIFVFQEHHVMIKKNWLQILTEI